LKYVAIQTRILLERAHASTSVAAVKGASTMHSAGAAAHLCSSDLHLYTHFIIDTLFFLFTHSYSHAQYTNAQQENERNKWMSSLQKIGGSGAVERTSVRLLVDERVSLIELTTMGG
jgi:preprotein translocase subunit SecG